MRKIGVQNEVTCFQIMRDFVPDNKAFHQLFRFALLHWGNRTMYQKFGHWSILTKQVFLNLLIFLFSTFELM